MFANFHFLNYYILSSVILFIESVVILGVIITDKNLDNTRKDDIMWIKKRPECNTIQDVVLANTSLTEDDFFVRTSKEFHIDQLDEAAALIKEKIAQNETITVIADYDADGICSAAIMYLALKAISNKEPVIRLPKRFSEGYGLSEKIVDEINEGLLITVDNGIAAIDAIKKAKDKGLTVIVTDHHLPIESGELPVADILIDPNAIPNSADFNGYCGAGLAYKLSLKLLPEDHKLCPKLLSLAAIATVADVMPLISENRLIVKNGLEAMTTYKGRTTGLGALLEVCCLDKHITAKNIGFKIGPVLNAPGRLFDDGATKSFELLSYNSEIYRAKTMAEELNNYNEDRKELKKKGLEILHQNISDNCLYGEVPLCIYQPDLPEGLVGIYAGSLAEEYKTPCFVFTNAEEEGVLKGSGRSYGGVHLKNLLDSASDLLYKYGGHAEAAGVSVLEENFEKMKESFFENIPEMEPETDNLYYDLEITANDIPATLAELEKFAPFGEGNPEIVFCIKDFMLSPSQYGFYKTMGADGQTIKLFGAKANAIGFGMLPNYIKLEEPKTLTLAGTLAQNFFLGKAENQVELIDFQAVITQIKRTAMAEMLAKKAAIRNKLN